MYRYQSRLLPLPVWIFTGLLLFSAAHLRGQSNARATITPIGTPPFVLGDVVPIAIRISAGTEKITGMELYLTLDPTYFKPVLNAEDRPFDVGKFLRVDAFDNDLHGDSLHLDPGANGIPGWQLDFVQLTSPGPNREYGTGNGTAGTFYVEIVGLPPVGAPIPTIKFEDKITQLRQTGHYYILGDRSARGRFTNYPCTAQIPIAGLAINPAIPDTILTPGSGLDIYLGDHFASNLVDTSDAIWTEVLVSPASLPGGASFSISPAGPSPSSRLIMTTGATNHFILDANIYLEGTSSAPVLTFYDYQPLRVIVDYLPEFDVPLPSFTFDEDVPLSYAANADAGGVLFSDQDDFDANLTFWLEPDSRVHLSYDDANTVTFSADTNWFGTQDARLYIQDGLGMTIDTLLTFTVNSVNDTPWVNFDNVSEYGDTIIIYHGRADTLDLKPLIQDVDNASFTISLANPDTTNLWADLLPDTLLRLEAKPSVPLYFGNIDLIITAEDAYAAQASDTLVVSIRSWPPVIDNLPDIRILAGTPDTLSLNELVSDNDTDDALMTWSFSIVDFADTLTPDTQVSYTYDQATQTVIFTTPVGYAATDLLIAIVQDDDNNTDADTSKLAVFATLSPVTFIPADTLVLYRDSVTDVYDLDDYVLDPIYDPEDLTWSYVGGDSLESVYIDPASHLLTLTTDAVFFGWDSLTLFVSNIDDYSDTVGIVLRIIPRTDGPPVWAPFDDVEIVYPDTIDLFFLKDVCKDDFTAPGQIIFTGYTNSDPAKPVDLFINPVSGLARVAVPAVAIYDTWVYFSAEDDMGQIAYSDTLWISVKDSYSPVWSQIPLRRLYVNQTDSSLILQNYLSDRDTPLANLTVTFVNPNPLISVSYNTTTTRVTIVARNIQSDSRLTFTAVDPEGNSVSTQIHVLVIPLDDFTPPDGNLRYFFNPVADQWIHYVLIGDSTTDRMQSTYIHDNRAESLIFAQQDSLPGTLTWTAPYYFATGGSYNLSVELVDALGNVRRLSKSLTVSLTKSRAADVTSPDGLLTLSYPASSTAARGLIIIAEEIDSLNTYTRVAHARPSLGKSRSTLEPVTIYALDTNLPEDIVVTLTRHNLVEQGDAYYSFFELVAGGPRRIDTFLGSDGEFSAVTSLGRDIFFSASDVPASKAPLPAEELFCWPNPFNSTVQVRFLLQLEDRGQIVIYNLLGQQVFSTPVQNFNPGVHTFAWQGVDHHGQLVSSGPYFVRLQTDRGKVLTRKVTLLK